VPGWGKLVAGTLIGAAGALYATNEEFRKQLPKTVRDLPITVRRRFEAAAAAAREASARRRAEILRELEAHGGDHTERRVLEGPQGPAPETLEPRTAEESAIRTEEV
jgi:hypothetical protein